MAGKVTCMKKNIDRGRQVFAFAAGTQKLYDYLDDNPACNQKQLHRLSSLPKDVHCYPK